MGIKFSSKARVQNLKKKLADLGVDVEALLAAPPNQGSPSEESEYSGGMDIIVPRVVEAVMKELKMYGDHLNLFHKFEMI